MSNEGNRRMDRQIQTARRVFAGLLASFLCGSVFVGCHLIFPFFEKSYNPIVEEGVCAATADKSIGTPQEKAELQIPDGSVFTLRFEFAVKPDARQGRLELKGEKTYLIPLVDDGRVKENATGSLVGYQQARRDNHEKQIWGKDSQFAGDGSFSRVAGAWNFMEVVCARGELSVLLNGIQVSHLKTNFVGRIVEASLVDPAGEVAWRRVRTVKHPGGEPNSMTRHPGDGFETYFGYGNESLRLWRGVSETEGFDNPYKRHEMPLEKVARLQAEADIAMTNHWFVRGGSLFFDGWKGGYSLATCCEYEDFELWADWRLLSIKGDSGIYLRGTPQVQVWDAHNESLIGSGGLYNNQTNISIATSIQDRQVGDWNRFHVIMRENRVTVELNGVKVTDDVLLENYWQRDRPILQKERIELQCHGDPIEWRNIYIKELAVPRVRADRIGVCSWSWQTSLKGVAERMQSLAPLGIRGVHLSLTPFINPDERHGQAESEKALDFVKQKMATKEWRVFSTMIGTIGEDYSTLESIRKTGGLVPDETWADNQKLFLKAIDLTAELKVPYLSFHAGFINEKDPVAFVTFLERLRWVRDAASKKGVTLLLESGQEDAYELRRLLERLPGVYVNFDPANMVLYGKGDPVQAIRVLAPWIKQVHVKDAIYSPKKEEWGTEVIWGEGAVRMRAFIQALETCGFKGAYVIEREGGSRRAIDIHRAAELLLH